MKTVKDVFATFKQNLIAIYDAYETEAITLMVLAEITGISKAMLKAFPEKELTSDQAGTIHHILSRLQTAEPLQYILGHTEFYGLTFGVNPSVLIPRPETEELVAWALGTVGSGQLPLNLLDIGTGSGCIAISLKKHLPGARISAIDISAAALKTARENALSNQVDIEWMQVDILNPASSLFTTPYSLIISNPPYVTPGDKNKMHANVNDFEPHTALFVPEDDPLIFYKAIVDFAIENLAPNGLLFLEINESLGRETVELLTKKGFKNIELRQDMSGRDRMIRGTLI